MFENNAIIENEENLLASLKAQGIGPLSVEVVSLGYALGASNAFGRLQGNDGANASKQGFRDAKQDISSLSQNTNGGIFTSTDTFLGVLDHLISKMRQDGLGDDIATYIRVGFLEGAKSVVSQLTFSESMDAESPLLSNINDEINQIVEVTERDAISFMKGRVTH